MSAAGTFGAAIAAALSVSILVLDQDPPNGLVAFVAGCWVVGSSLQVAAGTMARNNETYMDKK
jgi:lipid-binding SYLF domain-containing protein